MRLEKIVGLDSILFEVSKCLGNKLFEWLTQIFINIMRPKRCLMNGENTLVATYKELSKLYKLSQSSINEYTMKKQKIEQILGLEKKLSKKQIEFNAWEVNHKSYIHV